MKWFSKTRLVVAVLLTLSQAVFVQVVGAQCPGPAQRTVLINLQRANVLGSTRAGQVPLTDTCGNQRYVRQVQINLDTINYIPAQTGNTANLSEFVTDTTGALWYIDWKGEAVQMHGGGTCDQDWLQIADASCPESINDSIYHQKYAAVGARYVWPGATFLVNDSSNVNGALQVIQGDRIVKLAFYDLSNETWTMVHGNGGELSVYVPQDGGFTVSTASGTPEMAVADVTHFQVLTVDSTIAMNQYPNTRRDTQAVANFLYTDDMGTVRSQSVDSFPLAGRGGIYGGSGLIPDSTSAEVYFGGFFQIAYPSGVFDPAIRVTDNPPTTSRQVDINSTNATIQVYPNNVTVEAQDGVNMISNDGSEMEGAFFMSPYSVGFSLDSSVAVGFKRVYADGERVRMQASNSGEPGASIVEATPSYSGNAPSAQMQVSWTGALYETNSVFVDTTGVKIETFGSFGSPGQVLRNSGGYLVWADTTAISSVNIYNSNGSISTNRTVTLSDTLLFDAASSAGSIQYNSLTGNNLEIDETQIQFGDITNAADGIGLKADAALVILGDVFDLGNTYISSGTGGNYVRSDASNLQQTLSNTLWTINDGYFFFQDLRTTKPGLEYSLATLGADFTDSTLVHRRYVSDMIYDSINTNTVQPPAVENIENSNFTALKWLINEVDCTGGAISVTPPASPVVKDRFAIVDSNANAATNNITIDFTGASQKLNGSVQDFIMNCDGCYIEFVYMGSTTGWVSTK